MEQRSLYKHVYFSSQCKLLGTQRAPFMRASIAQRELDSVMLTTQMMSKSYAAVCL